MFSGGRPATGQASLTVSIFVEMSGYYRYQLWTVVPSRSVSVAANSKGKIRERFLMSAIPLQVASVRRAANAKVEVPTESPLSHINRGSSHL